MSKSKFRPENAKQDFIINALMFQILRTNHLKNNVTTYLKKTPTLNIICFLF